LINKEYATLWSFRPVVQLAAMGFPMVSLGIKRGKEREKEKKERGKGGICEALPAFFCSF